MLRNWVKTKYIHLLYVRGGRMGNSEDQMFKKFMKVGCVYLFSYRKKQKTDHKNDCNKQKSNYKQNGMNA